MSDKKKILSASDIINSDDLSSGSVEIDVPEWGGTVLFRPMSAEEAINWTNMINAGKKNDAWLKIFAQCAVDETGARLFPVKEVEALKKKSVKVFFRLQHQLMALNGMGRGQKTWESLQRILIDAGVDQSIIALVETKWDTPEVEAKND